MKLGPLELPRRRLCDLVESMVSTNDTTFKGGSRSGGKLSLVESEDSTWRTYGIIIAIAFVLGEVATRSRDENVTRRPAMSTGAIVCVVIVIAWIIHHEYTHYVLAGDLELAEMRIRALEEHAGIRRQYEEEVRAALAARQVFGGHLANNLEWPKVEEEEEEKEEED
jgi:hypothetical protein